MKIKFLTLLTLLFALVFSLSAQSLEEATESAKLYNEANKLKKAGDFAGAIAKYDEALKGSNDYRIYYAKGLTLKSQNKLNDAIQVYQKCTEINPEYPNVYSGLGTVYYASGDYMNAIDNFKKFTGLTTAKKSINKINGYIARAYTKLGMVAKTDAKYNLAVEHFTNAVKSHPLDAAYLALAEVHVETGAYDKALAAADNAINNRKKISKGAAYYYKGLAFKGKKDKAKAIENFDIAKKDRKYKANSEYELKLLNE